MEIHIRSLSLGYLAAQISDNNTSIDLGVLNEHEARNVALMFLRAAEDLSPRGGDQEEWFWGLLAELGYSRTPTTPTDDQE